MSSKVRLISELLLRDVLSRQICGSAGGETESGDKRFSGVRRLCAARWTSFTDKLRPITTHAFHFFMFNCYSSPNFFVHDILGHWYVASNFLVQCIERKARFGSRCGQGTLWDLAKKPNVKKRHAGHKNIGVDQSFSESGGDFISHRRGSRGSDRREPRNGGLASR